MVAVVALIKKTEMANGSEQLHHSVLLLDSRLAAHITQILFLLKNNFFY